MIENTQPLVTLGIPTYNRADGYLKQALESAVNQTYQNIEVVVSDNCSTDNTEEVVKGFSDPRIRYFKHIENIGANNNFNFCLEQARGDYFLLLHDDDLIDMDFVETCMSRVDDGTDIGIICTGMRVIDGQGRVKREIPNDVAGLSTDEFFRRWFRPGTGAFLCSTLFKVNRLREIGGFKSKNNLYQDVMAEFQLAARYGRIDIDVIKASFRKHEAEATYAAKIKDWCEDSLILLDLMCELASENKTLIRREGMYFFAQRNYSRAKAIKSFRERVAACLLVFKMFNYRYLPPLSILFPRNPISRAVRYLKRRTEKPDNTRFPFSGGVSI